jgi:hypothetical protein
MQGPDPGDSAEHTGQSAVVLPACCLPASRSISNAISASHDNTTYMHFCQVTRICPMQLHATAGAGGSRAAV